MSNADRWILLQRALALGILLLVLAVMVVFTCRCVRTPPEGGWDAVEPPVCRPGDPDCAVPGGAR